MNDPAIDGKTERARARLATIEALRSDFLPKHLDPVPSTKTLHAWFKRANVPFFKANPAARGGGGQIFYSVSAVEKLIRRRTSGADHEEGGAS